MAGIVSTAALHAQPTRTVGVVYQVTQGPHLAYVVASSHGHSPEPIALSQSVKKAIEWSDVIAFEALPGSERRNDAVEARHLVRRTRDRRPLSHVIPPELAIRIERLLDRRGASEAQRRALDDTKIEFASGRLTAIVAALDAPGPASDWQHAGVDMLVRAEATRQGRRLEELESATRLLRNRFTLSADEALADLEQVVDRLERDPGAEQNDAYAQRLHALMFAGDLDSMYALYRAGTCGGDTLRIVCDKLVDGRNPYLAWRIAERIASGEKVVAVVGAMHVAGPNSVLAELRRRGYAVRRMP